jgi:prolyl-tRNA editing enzyme YbaK/EbsC (Cys-tRNA(Pro) deacylase)
MEREYVIVGGGNRSTKIRLAPAQLSAIPHLTVIENLAVPRG